MFNFVHNYKVRPPTSDDKLMKSHLLYSGKCNTSSQINSSLFNNSEQISS